MNETNELLIELEISLIKEASISYSILYWDSALDIFNNSAYKKI